MLYEYISHQDRYLTTQHERDNSETGYDYRGARFYDGEVGRFLSLDPHAMSYSNLSAYTYVRNRPILFIDPDGKDDWAVNQSGHFKNLKETKTNDVIYAVGGNGNQFGELKYNNAGKIKNENITLPSNNFLENNFFENGAYKNGKDESGDYILFRGGATNAQKTFEFLADNTSAEFHICKYKMKMDLQLLMSEHSIVIKRSS